MIHSVKDICYVYLNSVKVIVAIYFPSCVAMFGFQKACFVRREKFPEETSGGIISVTLLLLIRGCISLPGCELAPPHALLGISNLSTI